MRYCLHGFQQNYDAVKMYKSVSVITLTFIFMNTNNA